MRVGSKTHQTHGLAEEEVQWKEQGIENPRVGGSIPPRDQFSKQKHE